MSLPWFRMYHEFAGDPVIQCLAFEDQRHFVMVLCLKAAGFLERDFPSDEFRNRMVCHALGLDPVAGSEAKRRLMEVGLVLPDWQPRSWDKRQFQSDNVTARTRKFRAKARNKNTDSDSDTDTESNVPENVPGTFQKNTKATRIPESFGLTQEREAYAAQKLPKVDAAALMEAFRDHWTAATGQKAVKRDWDAAWRTWVRNSIQFGYPQATAAASVPVRVVRFDANGREIAA
jgi:hypothetical protein